MWEIIIYFLEGLLLGYFDYKFIDRKVNYFVLIIFSFCFTLINIVADAYFIFPYINTLMIVLLLYLLNHTKIDQSKSFFIATFLGICIFLFDNLSLMRIIFILKTSNEGVWFSTDQWYILILTISKVMMFFILFILDRKKFFNSLIVNNKYLNTLSILSLINCFVVGFIANAIYMNEISYQYVYSLVILFMITILIVLLIIIKINQESLEKQKQEIEYFQLKEIEEKYIMLKTQAQRNEEIKHDLHYFMDLVNQQHHQEISEVLKRTIHKIDENSIKIYTDNKIMNSLLEKLKVIAIKNKQEVLYNINVGSLELSMADYNQMILLFEKLCHNNQINKIEVTMKIKNNYLITEFKIKPKKKMNYHIEENYLMDEIINGYQIIKYVSKI